MEESGTIRLVEMLLKRMDKIEDKMDQILLKKKKEKDYDYEKEMRKNIKKIVKIYNCEYRDIHYDTTPGYTKCVIGISDSFSIRSKMQREIIELSKNCIYNGDVDNRKNYIEFETLGYILHNFENNVSYDKRDAIKKSIVYLINNYFNEADSRIRDNIINSILTGINYNENIDNITDIISEIAPFYENNTT